MQFFVRELISDMGDDQLANVEAAYVALLTGTCDDVHETVRRSLFETGGFFCISA